MELSQLADQYNHARKVRLAEQKKVELLETEEKSLKDQLIAAMKAANAAAIGGQTVIVELKSKDEPTVGNWDKYYAHVRATGEFDLLYRRINPKAVKERKDLGVDVPGIDWFPVETLSLSQK